MAYGRLKKLGDEKFEEIKTSMAEGTSPNAMAKIIQGEWKEFLDVSENTLTQQLKRLKMGWDTKSLQVTKTTTITQIPVEVVHFDCQSELADLVALQKQRIKQLVEKEKGMPMPFPTLGPMIKDLASLIKDIEDTQKSETQDVWMQLFEAGDIKDVG